MTPEDAARQTTAHTEEDDPDFDTGRGLSWGALLGIFLWLLVLWFLYRAVSGDGL
jgi:hypothetical protein